MAADESTDRELCLTPCGRVADVFIFFPKSHVNPLNFVTTWNFKLFVLIISYRLTAIRFSANVYGYWVSLNVYFTLHFSQTFKTICYSPFSLVFINVVIDWEIFVLL